MALNTAPSAAAGDDLFALIVEAHDALDVEVSRRLDAVLVLLLANHIGSTAILAEALAVARATLVLGENPANHR
jgi:hypothetical protein